MRIIVEGWRFLFHSYSVINQFILMEMSKRPHLHIFHKDMPFLDKKWETHISLTDPKTQILRQISSPSPQEEVDAVFRIYCPWNFHGSPHGKTWVFALTEWGVIDNNVLGGIGVSHIGETPVNSEVMVITSSNWSKQGLIHSGIKRDRISVIPLGFDPSLYYPLPDAERKALRRALGWEDSFVFLNLGGCNARKGIRVLLKAFACIAEQHPQVKLVLKGSDVLYGSQAEIEDACKMLLSDYGRAQLLPKISYTGSQLSYQQIAQLYQGADVYVSPYLAEGFNLPVLEAAACGLPVICTENGPTDDFTHPDFAFRISSQLTSKIIQGETLFLLEPNWEHLVSLMENAIAQPALISQARLRGPEYVNQRFTWKHIVDQILETMTASPTRTIIRKPSFEPIIL